MALGKEFGAGARSLALESDGAVVGPGVWHLLRNLALEREFGAAAEFGAGAR